MRPCLVTLFALLALVPAARAQQSGPRIGYVYPAGGQQGATFEAVIGGQFLGGVARVDVSGGGVQATLTELIRPISGRELNDLRIQIDEMLARKAVVRKDFRALEAFRSFKNAKNVKNASPMEDKEIEALKKKYANATWTSEDDRRLLEIRRKIGTGVRRPANPAISELAVVQVTVAPDAKIGQRELRIAANLGLSNPLTFCVGQLPETSEKASKTITQQVSAIQRTGNAPKSRKAEPEPQITLPAVVNGQILPGEVDRYRFTADKGQRLVLAASARQLIPYIADAVPGWFQATLAIYDAQGHELAYDDDYRFDPDPVLYCQIPADGEYVLEIKDAIYRGREDFVYRIAIGELPFVTGVFPLGGPAGERTSVQLTGWNLPVDKLKLDGTNKEPGVYPLSVRQGKWTSNLLPFAVDALSECMEKEPNSEPAAAQRVTMPVIVNGRVDPPDDCDVFSFEGRAGSQLVAEVYARRLNSPLDSLLKLTDATGRQLALNDDSEDKGAALITHQADSRISITLPASGVYYLHLRDAQHQGGSDYAYRLRISPPQPDFALRIVPSTLNTRAGSTIPLTVYALRKDGFSGEIALRLKDAPKGFALGGARVPSGQDQVRITLTMPSTSPEEPVSLKLEGRATIDGRQVVRPVVPTENMIQAFEYRHLVACQEMKVTVAGRAAGRGLLALRDESLVKIPAGGTARVQVRVPSAVLDRVVLNLSEPPEGIAIQDVAATDNGVEIVLKSDSAKAKPGLKGNLIVTASPKRAAPRGKGKPQANPRAAPLATLPAIPFEVVAP